MNNINRLIDHEEFDPPELKKIIADWTFFSNQQVNPKKTKVFINECVSLLNLFEIEKDVVLPMKVISFKGDFEITEQISGQFKNVLVLAWLKLNNLSRLRLEQDLDTVLYQDALKFEEVEHIYKMSTRNLFQEIKKIKLSEEVKDILSFECRLMQFSSDLSLDYNPIARRVHVMVLRRYSEAFKLISTYDSLIKATKDIGSRVNASNYGVLEFIELLEKYRYLFK